MPFGSLPVQIRGPGVGIEGGGGSMAGRGRWDRGLVGWWGGWRVCGGVGGVVGSWYGWLVPRSLTSNGMACLQPECHHKGEAFQYARAAHPRHEPSLS